MANNTEQRVTSLEATVAEFVAQAARLLGDHGSRLSRVEAQLETLTALFQASDRRLNQLEQTVAANAVAIRDLQEVTRSHTETLGYLQDITRSNSENIQTLAAIVQTNEQRFAQLSLSQEQVLSRMDDVIAVMRERL